MVIRMNELSRSQLPLRNDVPALFRPQLHSLGFRGAAGGWVEAGAGHLSQSTAMDFAVTTSWFSPPLFSTQ